MRGLVACALILFAVVFGTPVLPQAGVDYDAWSRASDRIEQALAVGVISDDRLSELRDEVVDWRDQFLAQRDLGESRLQTIRDRMEALPAPPQEGGEEPPALAEERTTLDARLAQLQEPAIRAQLAFTHADGLIREIDEALRDRQARVLLHRLPVPVNPLNWVVPAQQISAVLTAIPSEIIAIFATPQVRQSVLRSLPGALIMAAVGVLLVVRAGAWTSAMIRGLSGVSHPVTHLVLEGVTLVVQLVLPLGGFLLLLNGIGFSGLLGETGTSLFQGLVRAVFWLIVGVWLIARIYPRAGASPASVVLSDTHAAAARRAGFLLVAAIALHRGVADLAGPLALSDLTAGYLVCVLVFPASLAIYQLGRLYTWENIYTEALDADDEEAPPFMLTVISGLARLVRLAAGVSPVAALTGYVNLAEAVIFPACYTVLLLGVLARMQSVVTRVFRAMSRAHDEDPVGLTPLVVNAALVCAALPALALMWGVRLSDMQEFWIGLREGVTLGGVHVSPAAALYFIVFFGAGYAATRMIQGLMAQTILPRTQLELGAQRAMTAGAGYIGILLTTLVAITATGIDLSNIAIVAGALSVGIGFGLQTIVSNFVSGIILLIERPVSEGDWIEVGGNMGVVKRISVRSTRIETFDKTDLIVPNSDLISGQVTNWTRGNRTGRIILPIGVAYGTDTRRVAHILQEIAEAHPMVAVNPAPSVVFSGFGASRLDFEVRAILRDVNFLLSVKTEINHQIAERFAQEGIEIPFPQQDLWVRNPEALRPAPRMP